MTMPGMPAARIAVLGEALIDLLPMTGGLRAVPGGSPANAAVAMARLGLDVTFLGGLSHDAWGQQVAEHLRSNEVACEGPVTDHPTALAVATVGDDGAASYRFLWDGTADREVITADLPDDLNVAALVVGSVDAVLPPVADAVLELVRRVHEDVVVVLDPNLRPSVTGAPDTTRERLLELAGYATIVRASDEDLAVLHPDLDPDEAAFQLLDGEATQLVAVTRGADGAWMTTPRFQLPIAAPAVDTVVDTVAAGDTFTAGLVAALAERDLLTRPALRRLSSTDAAEIGRFAAAAAAIVVTRAGADPPHRHDLPTP